MRIRTDHSFFQPWLFRFHACPFSRHPDKLSTCPLPHQVSALTPSLPGLPIELLPSSCVEGGANYHSLRYPILAASTHPLRFIILQVVCLSVTASLVLQARVCLGTISLSSGWHPQSGAKIYLPQKKKGLGACKRLQTDRPAGKDRDCGIGSVDFFVVGCR